MDVHVSIAVRQSPQEFVEALLAADSRYRQSPGNRWLAGVLATAQWLGGLRATRPVSGDEVPASDWSAWDETARAGCVVYGVPRAGDEGVHRDWALGALAMLEWARGVSDVAPVPLAGSRLRAPAA